MYDLKQRTFQFALDVFRFSGTLPKTYEHNVLKGQLVRSGTSVGSNYRASCRARSKPDFISKMSIVDEEADECMFWLEFIMALNLNKEEARQLHQEANEIVSIVVASKRTAKKRLDSGQISRARTKMHSSSNVEDERG